MNLERSLLARTKTLQEAEITWAKLEAALTDGFIPALLAALKKALKRQAALRKAGGIGSMRLASGGRGGGGGEGDEGPRSRGELDDDEGGEGGAGSNRGGDKAAADAAAEDEEDRPDEAAEDEEVGLWLWLWVWVWVCCRG